MSRRFDKRLSDYAKAAYERLERQRVTETGNKLRAYGYQYRIVSGIRSTEIAKIPMLLPHASFGILYRPVSPTRAAEVIIREVEEKYARIFEEQLAREMSRLTREVTSEELKKVGKLLFLSPETIRFD